MNDHQEEFVEDTDNDQPAETPVTEIVKEAAEWVPLASLIPNEKNPRKNDRTVPVVASSIRRFGWGSVIVARRENRQIIAGHTRRRAALLLAQQWAKASSRERKQWHPEAVRTATTGDVPVRWKDLDAHDAALLLVADNKIGETYSETDDDKLADLVRGLLSEDADIDLLDGTGFEEAALKALLDGEPQPEDVTGGDPGDGRYKEQYGVIVVCANESEQARVYEQLKGEGFDCKVVVT